MPSNLDLAVRALINGKQPPTVATVFGTYIRISGLDNEDANRSVLAFERALDKHPRRDDELEPVIARVRNDYWYTKLGGTDEGGGVCHTCEHCGTLSLPNQKHKHKGALKTRVTSKAGKHKL
ncbi:hypothetical protein E4T56_gene19476 [Termitomyces sp. T112]|nr:hypothetical protein C0989_012061 [Termitomyces sp. Mn162]KAG5728081.1 hypothetical protein E4T56_gene19476 [Termitomyces sp. T112]KAH0586617.1 hypothetical protein H2248_007837 [Termitomyces sp. 'cryptogamus']